MNVLTRLGLGIVAALTAATLTNTAPASAASITVSPGDRVDYVSPTAATQFCTIGYAYTAPDLHTYAITAGHCRTTAAGYARDNRSGLTGGFVRAIVDPAISGGADYGLIDFGIRSLRCHSSATPQLPTTTRSRESGNWCVTPGYPAANTAAASLPPTATTNT
jgi:hypothetical protein